MELAFDADSPRPDEDLAALALALDAEFLREVDEIFERAARGEILLDLDYSAPMSH